MAATTQFHWADVATQSDETADRRVISGTGADLRRVAVPAGSVAGEHRHPFEQFLLVQAGIGILTCASGEIALRPGVVIHFEPNAWHSAVFETDTILIEVNIAVSKSLHNN